jgi:hypothetical protein
VRERERSRFGAKKFGEKVRTLNRVQPRNSSVLPEKEREREKEKREERRERDETKLISN